MLPLEHSALLVTCIKQKSGIENQFGVFLSVAVLDRFYCTTLEMPDFIWIVSKTFFSEFPPSIFENTLSWMSQIWRAQIATTVFVYCE